MLSATALEGNTYYLGDCNQQSYGIVILSVGIYQKDTGETPCLESSSDHFVSQRVTSPSPLSHTLPESTTQICKEETCFLHTYFALFRAGTNPNCWKCDLTIIFLITQELRTPNLAGITLPLKVGMTVTLCYGPWHTSFLWSLEFAQVDTMMPLQIRQL